MKLVVDASVAIKWFLAARPDEGHLAQAESVAAAIENSQTELFAPPHWIAEIIGVLARVEPGIIDTPMMDRFSGWLRRRSIAKVSLVVLISLSVLGATPALEMV